MWHICLKVTVRLKQAVHFNNNMFAVTVIMKGLSLTKNEGEKENVSGFGLGSVAYINN